MSGFETIGAGDKENPALKKVQEFCRSFKCNILQIGKKGFWAERLDEKGEQDGIYVFSPDGALLEYNNTHGHAQLEGIIDELVQEGVAVKTLPTEQSEKLTKAG